MVAISIDEALNELSSSVDRLAVTIQPFQAFLAYSQGETFLQKLSQTSQNSHCTCVVRGIPAKTTMAMVEENFNLQLSRESLCIAHSVVDETEGNSCAATVTFQSEKEGRQRSCETLKNEFNGSRWLGTTSTISVVDDFMGLTPLSGAADAKIQYVHTSSHHSALT